MQTSKRLKFLRPIILPLVFISLYILGLYHPFFFKGELPIPADTVVGLYHPWRDSLASDYALGVPFKNFQITDPVRQQYPWRDLSIAHLKSGELPLWNPYSFSGTPLLANLQSAAFYPLNVLYVFLTPPYAWSLGVLSQLLLGSLFMYLFLRHLNLSPPSITLGVLAWIGSGFFIAWQEWNTVVHVVIWLPLILLAIDKLVTTRLSTRGVFLWAAVYTVSLIASCLAGYLQPFFYVVVVSSAYLVFRIWEARRFETILIFAICFLVFLLFSLPQLFPLFEFISHSARDIDQANWMRPDWFLPWENLLQFIAPDFFGNPATLNYFGVWNYQEFVGYIGIAPLFFAVLAVLSRNKKTLFFVGLLVFALIFTLPTPLAKIPFALQLPLISSSQPSRLIVMVDFALAILAAFGLESFLGWEGKTRKKVFFVVAPFILLAIGIFLLGQTISPISERNTILPLVLTLIVGMVVGVMALKPKGQFILALLLVVCLFDLLRFGFKFESFSNKDWLFPQTETLSFLQAKSKLEVFRIAAIDERILPPNFSVVYRLQTISGYDPLYLRQYAEFIAAVERNKPDNRPPFGFNRIITPKNHDSKYFDLLGVKYLLSLNEVHSPKYELLFAEGQTKVYLNTQVLPRAFFVEKSTAFSTKADALEKMFDPAFDPSIEAVLLEDGFNETEFSSGSARVISYKDNEVLIEANVTSSTQSGLLLLTDIYYPAWNAEVDGQKTKIYLADYVFRAVLVPPGQHRIRFFISLLSP